MAHELDIRNGKAACAYVGETPWHGLGSALKEGASIDVWAREAGMEYEVLTAPISYAANGKNHTYGDRVVSYRSDTGEGLGIVSRNFQMVQPKDCLAFFEDLATLHGFQLETAGVLFNGRKYWALARTPKEFKVGKKDIIRGRLLMATACDGSMATTVKYVCERVVCHNTFSMAMSESNNGGTLRMRHNQKFKPEALKEELGLYDAAWLKFKEQASALAKRNISGKEVTDYLVKLFGDPSKPLEEQPSLTNMKTINDMFVTQNYIGHEMSGNTAWGLVNVVVEWLDWKRARDQNRRLDYAYFGGGSDLKLKAMEAAVELL